MLRQKALYRSVRKGAATSRTYWGPAVRYWRGIALVGLLAGIAAAQVREINENQGAAAAYQSLLRLRTTATVLHTTAHPDDEDGPLLTWLSRAQGVRTGLLTLTRGEGSSSFLGSEQYDALGVLRTEELLAADRFYGVDQFFGRVTDFGFDTRLDETLKRWSSEPVLGDVVRVVRMYRPDVIISRWHGKERDGHGNHQAAGYFTFQAFTAAADPKRFPEHLREGLRPWQAKKLYVSVRDKEPTTLRIFTGEYDALLGRSYHQMAREGLSYHRTQGAGRLSLGPPHSALQLIHTVLPNAAGPADLFAGLDTTLVGLAKLAPASLGLEPDLRELQKQVETAIERFDARRPWAGMPQVVAGLRLTRRIIEKVKAASFQDVQKQHLTFLLRNKEQQFVDAGNKLLCVGLEVLADLGTQANIPTAFFQTRDAVTVAIPGQKFSLASSVVNRSPVKMESARLSLQAPPGWQVTNLSSEVPALGKNEEARARFAVVVAEDAKFTRPYWSRKSHYRDHLYQIDDPAHLNLPWPPPEVLGVLSYEVEGVAFRMSRAAQTVFMERPWGERRRLLAVAPALSISAIPRNGVLPVAATSTTRQAHVTVMSNVPGAAGKLRLELPAGWVAEPREHDFRFTNGGEKQDFAFRLSIPKALADEQYTVRATAEHGRGKYSEGYQVIRHLDLEPRHLYFPATLTLRTVDVKVAPNLKVGYITGGDDPIPESLEQIGVKVQILGSQDLATGNLHQFDTILVGARAYSLREDLKAHNSRLLEYVERGGNLVVQSQEFDAVPFGPYSLKVTRPAPGVLEEDAAVTMLDADNPIFRWPNKVTPSDFDGWVEERGRRFLPEWDPRYKPLLECHDHGQAPQRGGLLQTRHGKGTFTYSAYSFQSQLPAAVPGAYRLCANMISQPRGQ